MIITDIEQICKLRNDELLDKYFGNLVDEASKVRPETIGEYTKDLPLKIEAEYRDFLEDLWHRLLPEDKKDMPLVFDEQRLRKLITDDDREMIEYAHDDATKQTLWERISHTNHKDVTYYKGLLHVYTKDLLMVMRQDFLEEITRQFIQDKTKAFTDIKICDKVACSVDERKTCKDYMTLFCRLRYAEKK